MKETCVGEAVVIKVGKSKEKSKLKPKPLETLTLQKLANRKLMMSSTNTTEIAKKLYSLGYISFPRLLHIHNFCVK